MLKLSHLAFQGNSVDTEARIPLTNEMFVWGDNTVGQLGLGDNTQRLSPTQNAHSTDITFKGNGSSRSASVLMDTGVTAVEGAGANTLGQLGTGSLGDQNAFVASDVDNSTVIYLEMGDDYSIYSDGAGASINRTNFVTNSISNVGLRLAGNGLSNWDTEIDTWSWTAPSGVGPVPDSFEALGIFQLTSPPAMGPAGRGAVGILVSELTVTDEPGGRTYARFNEFDLLIWESDLTGNLLSLVYTLNIDDIEWKKAITNSPTTSLVLSTIGEAYSYSSDNEFGEVGQNASIGGPVDLALFSSTLSNTTDIAGNFYNSFLLDSGQIYATGNWQTGAVGSATANVTEATLIDSNTDWVEIQAGEACLIARNSSNELHFIGNNEFGQKGDGTVGSVVTSFVRIDSPNLYSSYLVIARSVYAIIA